MRRWCGWIPVILGLILLLVCPLSAQNVSRRKGFPEDRRWDQVATLVKERKYAAALDDVERILAEARPAAQAEEWTEALVHRCLLQKALRRYEASVTGLLQSDWPEDVRVQSFLHLYAATALYEYHLRYDWEIRAREELVSSDVVALRSWTSRQIVGAIHGHLHSAWALRSTFGNDGLEDHAEFLFPGEPVEGVRETVREYLTYTWVDILANTSYWRPEHSQDLHLLDLGALARGVAPATVQTTLTDDHVHPLERITFLLADLGAWCSRQGRDAAALESHLHRIRKLGVLFAEEAQRETLRNVLLDILAKYRQIPWWAEGMFLLADLERSRNSAVRAHDILTQGYEAYPDSYGGRRCEHLIAKMEAPDYSLSCMSIDRAGARSIAVRHKNVARLHFRAYTVDPDTFVSEDWRRKSRDRARRFLGAGITPARSWSVELPDPGDFEHHQTYVTPPLVGHGGYLILASTGPEFDVSKDSIEGVSLLLSRIVITSQHLSSCCEVRVLYGQDGSPVPNATVQICRTAKGRTTVEHEEQTDSQGRVLIPFHRRRNGHRYLVARKGEYLAVDWSHLWLHSPRRQDQDLATLVYTDRTVYRPGQSAHVKVVAYKKFESEGTFRAAEDVEITVWLEDPKRKRIETLRLMTNEFGSASGTFVCPPTGLLGSYWIQTDRRGNARIQVEEYKRPTFEVELTEMKDPIRLNREVTIEGNATYYFGLPVSAGRVEYRIFRTPEYPRWYWWRHARSSRPGDRQVVTGQVELGPNGTFRFRFLPRGDETLPDAGTISYRYLVTGTVTDEGGETREFSRTYTVGFAAIRATITTPAGCLSVGRDEEIEIARTNLDGAAQGGTGEYSIFRLAQPSRATLPADVPIPRRDGLYTPGDTLRPRWTHEISRQQILFQWEAADRVAEGMVSHGSDGRAKIHWKPDQAGAYRIVYRTHDPWGALCETQTDLVVDGPGAAWKLPLFLIARRTDLSVGEVASIRFGSGVVGQTVDLSIYRDNQQIRSQHYRSEGRVMALDIPIDETLRGGFTVVARSIGDYQTMERTLFIQVPWDNKRLAISLDTFRDHLRPGDKETWTFRITGPDATCAAAEVLAYMYDRSLDFFLPHSFPEVGNLYPTHRRYPRWQHSLRGSGSYTLSRHRILVRGPDRTLPAMLRTYDGRAIGGLNVRAIDTVLEVSGASHLRGGQIHVRGGRASETAFLTLEVRSQSAVAESGLKEVAHSTQDLAHVMPSPERSEELEIRKDFGETAFFEPHLKTDGDGNVHVSFTVPQSVTEWNLYLHAITRDLKFHTERRRVVTSKELMVRPYLPRFLREGDRADLKVVINNAGGSPLAGRAGLRIEDPETGEDVSRLFQVRQGEQPWIAESHGSANLTWTLRAPTKVGTYAFRVVAETETLSDGELRSLPVLPGRMHLAQSQFVVLKDKDHRQLRIDDLARAKEDTTLIHSSLVLTVDAQLLFTVLKALPYLVVYPYDCVEQILNRFVSSAILSEVFGNHPAIQDMARTFSQRHTRLEHWETDDPNRRMALEETPWLSLAEGGSEVEEKLINLLDPEMVEMTRRCSLAKLAETQKRDGSFPWFPGGAPNLHMTLYVLQGLARAEEVGVETSKDLVVRAWQYLDQRYLPDVREAMAEGRASPQIITLLNYTVSCYGDPKLYESAISEDDRRRMLDYSFAQWAEHPPYIQGLLALTLHRMGRKKDARLVLDSIMDRAVSDPQMGTYWAPEDQAWLWYNDTVEGHALALRALMEIRPRDRRAEGLALWLLLQKKMNHWKSTRTTAEVIYSLVHYMEKGGSLGHRETITVELGPRHETLHFQESKYVGRSRLVLQGNEIDEAVGRGASVSKEGRGFALASMTWRYSTERLPAVARGDWLGVRRQYFLREERDGRMVLRPLQEGARVEVGDQIEVHLSIRSKHPAEYIHLRDPRPAGLEPETLLSRHRSDLGISRYEETRDSGTNFFFERLPQGEYTLKYRLRANMAGIFRASPAVLQSMYAPEFAAFSAGGMIHVH